MIALAALFGGLGAICRFLLDAWVGKHSRVTIPMGTIVVNVTACLLMGILVGWATSHIGSDTVRLLLGSGFLGGFSTFSTASVEGVRLIEAHKPFKALYHTGGMLVLSALATLLGMVVGG